MKEDIIKGNVAYPKTLNAYGYCWGNPVKFVDWDGTWTKLLENIGSLYAIYETIGAYLKKGMNIVNFFLHLK